jgi:hypothetical protein
MNIRRWMAPSIAIVAIAAAHCGGDDSTLPTQTGGSSGSAGAGTAGNGGTNAGTAGAAGTTTGSAGSGGSATGGSGGGSAGTAGSTGTAGSGGGGTGGNNADAAAGSGGGKADAAAGSGGTSDAGRSDAAADADTCPTAEPMDGDPCTGSAVCTYGNVGCGCVRAGGMTRQWQCQRIPDAARNPDCPATPPARNSSCADAGSGTLCRFGQGEFCVCNQQDQWRCNF